MREALLNAADHIVSMMSEETRAAASLERDGDTADGAEAERAFLKYFKAFIGEVRSARDYMTAAANKTGNDVWIRGRFEGIEKELFESFNALMNLTLHQYRPKLEPRSNQVQYVGEPDAVMLRRSWEEERIVHGVLTGVRQGGGVLSDMMCHSVEVGRFLLTRPGEARESLTLVSA